MPRQKRVEITQEDLSPEIKEVPENQPVEFAVERGKIVDPAKKANGQDQEIPVTEQNGNEETEITIDDGTEDLKKQLEAAENARRVAESARGELEKRLAEQKRLADTASEERIRANNDAEQAQYDAIVGAINSAQVEQDLAKRELKRAAEAQDWESFAETQARIADSAARLLALNEGRSAIESRRESRKNEPQRPNQAAAPEFSGDPVDTQYASLPQNARDWLKSHRNYISDPRLNAKLGAMHYEAIDEGHEQFSPPYFEAVERLMEGKKKSQPIPAAPVSRENQSMSGGRAPGRTTVTLTPEEREAARVAGVTELQYAAEKLRMENEKATRH
jgi:hypothetical protein